MPDRDTCPHCQSHMRDKPILSHKTPSGTIYPKEAVDAAGDVITESGVHVYRDGRALFGSRIIGVTIRGLYDGVLFWQCPDCEGRWHRWSKGDALWHRAEPYVNGVKKLT
jgi:hypothetical protein